jgi:hypothetical protein
VRQWLALEHKAVTGNQIGQKPVNEITWARLEQMRVPALLLIGDADLWSPPAVMRLFARHIPNNELVIVPEAGHPSTGSNRRFSTRRSSISSAGIRSSRGARFGAGVCHSDLACQHARCMFEPVLILTEGRVRPCDFSCFSLGC